MIAGCVVFAVLGAGQVGATEPAPSVPTVAVAVESVLPHINTEVLVEKRDGVFVAGMLESVSRTELILRLADGRTLALALADVASVRPKIAPPAAAQTPAAPKAQTGSTLGYESPRRGPPARLLDLLLRKKVVVFTTEDVTVRGRLVSFDDDSILVDSPRGEFEIELAAIKRIEEADSDRRAESRSDDDDRSDRSSPPARASAREESGALDDAQKHADASVLWFSSAGILAAAGAISCIASWYVCGVPLLVAGGGLLLGAGVSAVVGLVEGGAASASERKADIARRRGEMAY